ncbi:MAG: DsrE family protein [Nitrospirota bacterium]
MSCRSAFFAFLAVLAIGIVPCPAYSSDFDGLKRVRAVWDVTATESESFENKLALIQHAAEVLRKKGITPVFVVALNGPSVKFAAKRLSGTRFEKERIEEREDIQERLKEMHREGMRIITCKISMDQGKISGDNLLPFVAAGENVLATIAALQNKGYAYLPVRDSR